MSMAEFEDIIYEYQIQSDKRRRYLELILGFLNKLSERGNPITNSIKTENHIIFRFLEYDIKIQIDIVVTRRYGTVKWFNLKVDCNNEKISDCILTYSIDDHGVIQDGDKVYNLSFNANSFVINSLLKFLKFIEEKNTN